MKRIAISILMALAGLSCELADLSVGSMDLSIGNSISRTLGPAISMDAHSFQIRGTGPGNGSFILDTLQDRNLIENLTPGDWTVEIDAFNAAGDAIGYGNGTITVPGGDTAAASISVIPRTGSGILDLTLFWETADVATPVVAASLIPSSGGTMPLSFSETSPGTSQATDSLEAGYYTLILQLLDSDTVVMGTAETIRIAADQETSGIFDFTDVNSLDGSIDIGIDVDMKEPIEIVLSGTADTITAGQSMTVSAASPGDTDIITYTWYLNGSSLGSGTTMTTGAALEAGIYRLDVIALNDDFSRSGSVNHTFTVTEP